MARMVCLGMMANRVFQDQLARLDKRGAVDPVEIQVTPDHQVMLVRVDHRGIPVTLVMLVSLEREVCLGKRVYQDSPVHGACQVSMGSRAAMAIQD